MKRSLIICLVAVLLASCSKDYLSRDYSGGTVLNDQYEKIDGSAYNTLLGIYTKMYEYGDDHDAFGHRAIDMYGDFLCGDMAMKSSSYGWFHDDELGLGYSIRKGYIWSYYYDIIRLANMLINTLKLQGVPALSEVESVDDVAYERAYYYGEALALRGYAYAGLQRFFCKTVDVIDVNSELSVPIYTEADIANNNVVGQVRSTAADVYARIETDLATAVDYMSTYELERTSKLEIDADVARGLLAYTYLNEEKYELALKYAQEVIDGGNYRILPFDKLLTTGFGDVEEDSWMWGQNVTIDNTTALASFIGQVDIHSYSYAWAGDKKMIDGKLQTSIPTWDARAGWFDKNGCPHRKFYCVKTKDATKADDIDHDWLNDNVFMRIESIYLIAAEAAVQQSTSDLALSKQYLKDLLDQRVDTSAQAQADYSTYMSSLTSDADLLAAIGYNWRVELWGEGYGLQTLRRLTKMVMLGSNHLRSDKSLSADDYRMTFEMPSSETSYNPFAGQ